MTRRSFCVKSGSYSYAASAQNLGFNPNSNIDAGVCLDVLVDDDLKLPVKLPAKPKHS